MKARRKNLLKWIEMEKLLFFIGELVLKKRAVVYLMMMLILG